MIDVWINKGSGWNVESIESQYINISTSRPLSGNSYMELLVELKSPRKGLINIKNKDKSCFLWCHVRYINPSKEHFDRFIFLNTKNKDKKWFCKSCLQCFSSENVLIKHKENFLSINDKQ